MLVTMCDRCKKIISDKTEIEDTVHIIFSTKKVGVYKESDLCYTCRLDLSSFMEKESEVKQ